MWKQYKALKKEIRRECGKACNCYTNQMISEPHQSRRKKHFYKFVKSLCKDSCGIPTLVKDGVTYNTDLEKSNILNQHFCSVFTNNSVSLLPEMGQSPYPDIPLFDINVAGVAKLLDPCKATGLDGLLKEMSSTQFNFNLQSIYPPKQFTF